VSFASIVVSPLNPVYDSRENCNCIIQTKTNTVMKGCMGSTIPNTVNSIGEYAFYGCTGLTTMVVPDSVNSIDDYAFDSCSDLSSITFGSGLTSIGRWSFMYCKKLSTIICNALTAPSLGNSYTFEHLPTYGTLIYPEGSDYSSWLSTDGYYLGYYKWNQPKPIS
jgi:hypothetical protein